MAPATQSMTSDPTGAMGGASQTAGGTASMPDTTAPSTGGPTPPSNSTMQSTPTTQENILLTECFLTDPSWPSDLI